MTSPKNRVLTFSPLSLPQPLPFDLADSSVFLKKLRMLPFGIPLDFPLIVAGLVFVRPLLLGSVLDLPSKGIGELAMTEEVSMDFPDSQ